MTTTIRATEKAAKARANRLIWAVIMPRVIRVARVTRAAIVVLVRAVTKAATGVAVKAVTKAATGVAVKAARVTKKV